MQQRGVERDQLLALQAVDDIARRLREIERFELLGDGVQAPQRPAVVVLVVALDELERKPAQRPGTAVDLLQLIAHDDTSKHKVELRPDGLRTLVWCPHPSRDAHRIGRGTVLEG